MENHLRPPKYIYGPDEKREVIPIGSLSQIARNKHTKNLKLALIEGSQYNPTVFSVAA